MATEEQVPQLTEELYCYRDASRLCGPECTAWVSNPVEDVKGRQTFIQRHCLLLSSTERMARHVVILAGVVAELSVRLKVDAQDKKRAEAMGGGGPFANPFPINPKDKP